MECPRCNPCNCPDPDFIERNGAWLLTVIGMFAACAGGVFTYFLKSRCRNIKCWGLECQRDVLALDPSQVSVTTTSDA